MSPRSSLLKRATYLQFQNRLLCTAFNDNSKLTFSPLLLSVNKCCQMWLLFQIYCAFRWFSVINQQHNSQHLGNGRSNTVSITITTNCSQLSPKPHSSLCYWISANAKSCHLHQLRICQHAIPKDSS